MSETVFVLGAGASKQGGAPVMSDFMQEAERVLTDAKDKDKLDVVLSFMDDCKYLHSYAKLDLENLETLYGIAEMAQVTGRFPNYDHDKIHAVVDALTFVISATIERTLSFPSQQQRVYPPSGYYDLVDLLKEREKPISFITLNYDLGLDYALYFHRMPMDYCLGPVNPGGTKVSKLHGSLNWFLCPKCRQVVPWTLAEFFSTHSWNVYRDGPTRLDISQKLHKAPHPCTDVDEPRRPLIVPPTWNKPAYQSQLSSVWASAAKSLSDVRDLHIVGFSLPDTDLFFRYLYSVGAASARLRSIRVFDPSPSVGERFERLLGEGAKSKFKFEQCTFMEMVSKLSKEH